MNHVFESLRFPDRKKRVIEAKRWGRATPFHAPPCPPPQTDLTTIGRTTFFSSLPLSLSCLCLSLCLSCFRNFYRDVGGTRCPGEREKQRGREGGERKRELSDYFPVLQRSCSFFASVLPTSSAPLRFDLANSRNKVPARGHTARTQTVFLSYIC